SSNTFFIMSITTSTINVRGNLSTSDDIPYTKYFELCSYDNWSLHHYVSLIIDNYKFARKDRTHQVFFMTLESINKNSSISQDIRDIAQNLIKNRK
ncbi:11749_t:CDS:1, partial [Funneliformis geosporum]